MSNAHVLNADCLAALRDMPDASVDAIVTDPPYGLSNTTPAQVADTITRWASGDREYLPTSVGFMGHEWDGFVPPVAVWDECLRVLKPGGHLLAFAGSRTHDLMTLGIRLAGFEIRDSVAWLYGSGFPKSLDVSKAIDKAGGNPLAFREFADAYAAAVKASPLKHSDIDRHLGIKSSSCYWARHDHRGGMPPRHHWEKVRDLMGLDSTMERLYEAAEREVIGSKSSGIAVPGEAARYTVGGSRSVEVPITAAASDAAREWEGWGTALKPAMEPITLARKPLDGTVAANVQEHGTGALNIDACRVPTTDKLSGGHASAGQQMSDGWRRPWMDDPDAVKANIERSRASVAKSESLGRWPANVVLDESQAAELDRQSGVSVSSGGAGGASGRLGYHGGGNGNVGSSAGGFGDKGGASRFFYVAKAPKSERPVVDGIAHPTVKPVALMRWLVRMVTPPGGVVLDPFAGSGTTLEAAMLEGFNVIGVEREADYLPLIRARIERATAALAAQAEADADTLFPIDGAAS